MTVQKLYLEAVTDTAKLPVQATEYSAGLDICADFTGRTIQVKGEFDSFETTKLDNEFVLPPHSRALIPTGWKMQCALDHCIKLYPRSGNAWKHGIRLANGTGIVDADFPNEVMAILHNTTDLPFVIEQGERIAQICVERVTPVDIQVVTELPPLTSIRNGGFGHSGKQ